MSAGVGVAAPARTEPAAAAGHVAQHHATGAVTAQQFHLLAEHGYCSLGVLDAAQLHGLSDRVNEIMLGRADNLDYGRLLMQTEDGDGRLVGGRGHSQGPTLAYSKVQGLEHDPVVREYMRSPLFRAVARRVYGPTTAVAVYRSMLINKPSGGNEVVGWHMDQWATLDRDPKVSVYLALDAQTEANGCLYVAPGSHLLGIGNERSSGAAFLPETRVQAALASHPAVPLPLQAGEVVLLATNCLHSSGANPSKHPRRAISVCLMEAATRWSGEGGYRETGPIEPGKRGQDTGASVLFGGDGHPERLGDDPELGRRPYVSGAATAAGANPTLMPSTQRSRL